jgi:hypothetical protein
VLLLLMVMRLLLARLAVAALQAKEACMPQLNTRAHD